MDRLYDQEKFIQGAKELGLACPSPGQVQRLTANRTNDKLGKLPGEHEDAPSSSDLRLDQGTGPDAPNDGPGNRESGLAVRTHGERHEHRSNLQSHGIIASELR